MRTVLIPTLLFGAALFAQPRTAQQPPATVKAVNPGGVVNLNTADTKELSQLPGVSKSTAEKIVAHRPYGRVEDLSRAGVSQKTIDRIRPLVNVEGTGPAG